MVALVAAWPAIGQPGLLNTRGGGDSPFLLQRLHQLATALAEGHFPVRWMPDANYGYGYPFYNFYAPLSIYVAAAFRFLGFSFVRAIHLAQLAGFVVAGLGTYYLGRRWLGSPWAGLLATVAYTVAPFHMVNVYVRGDSLAEFWAMAFYPWVLLAADRLVASVPLFALAYAALILSHNISALIFSPFVLGLVLLKVIAEARGSVPSPEGRGLGRGRSSPPLPRPPAPLRSIAASLLWPAAAFALAFALAAWSFVPALAEQDLAQLSRVTEGYFHYSNHFRGQNLVQGSLLFDYNPDGGTAFRMGLAQTTLALAGAAVMVWRWWNDRRRPTADRGRSDERRVTSDEYSPPATRHSPSASLPLAPGPWPLAPFFILAAFTLATFMITPLSRPLWDHLPLLPFTQFPWRFLSVQALFAALLTGGLVAGQGSRGAGEQGSVPSPGGRGLGRGRSSPPPPRSSAPLLAIAASLILLASALLGLRTDPLILTDADVTAERLAQYEWFTGNIGTTVSAEYLTPASSPRPWTSAWLNDGERDGAVAVVGELRAAALLSRSATVQVWEISAGLGGATLVLPTLMWPGWTAEIDGQPADMAAQPGSGLMALVVPEGRHAVTLALGRTAIRAAAEWLSLLTLATTAALLLWGALARPSNSVESASSDADSAVRTATGHVTRHALLRGLSSVVCGLLALAALALLWRNDPTDLPRDDLTWDFAQMGYLHHDPGGVPFEGGARLYTYGYSADEIAAGETLTVTLSVAPGDGRAATLALATPATARPAPDGAADPPLLVAATQSLAAETITFALPIPPDAPPGLYAPRLTLDGAQPLLPSGGTRGDLFLRPVRITTADGRPPTAAGAPTDGRLQTTARSEATGNGLNVQATSLTTRDPTTLDGRFAWYTALPLGARYQFSWRLQDPAGGALAQLDAQPGYGYQPSDGWPAGEWTADWLALRLPEAAPAEGDYPLVMRLYDVNTGQTLLTRRVGVLAWAGGEWRPRLHEPAFALPEGLAPVDVTFGSSTYPFIALGGYRLERKADELQLTLYWRALDDVRFEYTRFVHLLDATGAIAAQADSAPAGDSYPTGQWVAGEVVADTITFDLSALPPGDYTLATGFYRPVEGFPRLDALGPNGPLSDARALLPETITVGQ